MLNHSFPAYKVTGHGIEFDMTGKFPIEVYVLVLIFSIPAMMHKSLCTWSLYIDAHILPYQHWCTNLRVHEVYILMPIFSIPAMMHKYPCTWSLYLDTHILPYQQWCTNLHVHEVYILMPKFSHTSSDAQISMYVKSISWCPYSPIPAMIHKSPCTWSLYIDAHILPYQHGSTNLHVHVVYILMPVFSHTSIDAQISMYMKSIYWCPYYPIPAMMNKSPCTRRVSKNIVKCNFKCIKFYFWPRDLSALLSTMSIGIHLLRGPWLFFSLCVFYSRIQPWRIPNSTAIPWNSDIVWQHYFYNQPCI